MTQLTFYHAVPSRGLVVHWMLEELGVPFEMRILNFEAQEQRSPSFLAINPLGRVPTLTNGDTVVTETAAIVAYLAELYPDKGLGVDVHSSMRGDYLRWLFFSGGTVEPSIAWQALGDVVANVDYQPFADIESVAQTLAQAVTGKEFLLGDRFTAADVIIGSTVNWGINMMPLMPRLPGAGGLLGTP